MTLTTLQQLWIPKIEGRLHSALDRLDFSISDELKSMLTYHMGWADNKGGGKRLRPLISLLSAGSFGANPEKALPGALAIELLHNFTLIHDDIEDKSEIRHGRQTLWQRWGIALAINAGDALFSIAQLTLLSLDDTLNDKATVKASRRFNEVCLHLTQGQHLDIAFEQEQRVTEADYVEMVRGKTAALIGFSAWLGGLAAHQEEMTLSALYDFGENLGMAFQMQDDLLGIWGDPNITGKSAASDIQNRKKTLPILYGLAHSREFQSMWEKQNKSDVNTMADILEACGARVEVQHQAKTFTDIAFEQLEILFPKPNDYAIALVELVTKLLQRDF